MVCCWIHDLVNPQFFVVFLWDVKKNLVLFFSCLSCIRVVRHICHRFFAPPGFNLKDACTLHRWYLDSYKGQMADDSTLKLSMNTNSAYIGLTHPMNPVDGGGVLGFGEFGGRVSLFCFWSVFFLGCFFFMKSGLFVAVFFFFWISKLNFQVISKIRGWKS